MGSLVNGSLFFSNSKRSLWVQGCSSVVDSTDMGFPGLKPWVQSLSQTPTPKRKRQCPFCYLEEFIIIHQSENFQYIFPFQVIAQRAENLLSRSKLRLDYSFIHCHLQSHLEENSFQNHTVCLNFSNTSPQTSYQTPWEHLWVTF